MNNSRFSLTTLLVALIFGSPLFGQEFLNEIDFGSNSQYEGVEKDHIFLKNQDQSILKSAEISEVLEDAFLSKLDSDNYRQLLSRGSGRIKLDIPISVNREITVLLKKVNLFSERPKIKRASDNRSVEGEFTSLFYWGVVEGFEGSMVSISFFDGEVIGFISFAGNNLSIARMEGSKKDIHIIYDNADLNVLNQSQCFFEERIHAVEGSDDGSGARNSTNNCLNIYVEANYDIYQNKGSVAAASAYVLGAFSQVAILYSNEGIDFAVSEVLVWDEPSPYTGPSSGNYLTQFRNHLDGNYNGDLAHLVGFGGGGGVAYLNVLCNSFLGVAYSGIGSSYNDVPVYSWTVMVIAHEIGHNVGSRHTHACAWNGNNTAIDGCGPEAGYSEGCDGPLPSDGTIMSYCHLISGVGIDFDLGFGDQPGSLMVDKVDNAACLGPCAIQENDAGIAQILSPELLGCDADITPEVVLLNFGTNELDSVIVIYQFNQETPDSMFWSGNLESLESDTIELTGFTASSGANSFVAYTSMPNGVVDSISTNDSLAVDFEVGEIPMSLTIVLDNYPGETSWDIEDDNGEIILTGGNYSGYPNGDTVQHDFCLTSDQCYTFTIYDSYGDGICCAWGEGSYELVNTHNGVVVASGGEFEDKDSTDFCLDNILEVFFADIVHLDCDGAATGSAAVVVSSGNGPFTFNWSNGQNDSVATQLDAGYHYVTVNNSSEEVVDSVFIESPAPPVAECQDITVELDVSGLAVIEWSDIDNQSFDSCGISSISISDSLFDCNNIGEEIVFLHLVNEAGMSDSCESSVSVVDAIPPELSCPDSVEVGLENEGDSEVFVEIALATGHDNCVLEDLSNNYNSGGADASDFYPIGLTSVHYEAIDSEGNTTNCTTEVMVLDTVFPPDFIYLSGGVSTSFGVNLEGVEMIFTADSSFSDLTTTDGNYSLVLPYGSTGEVEAHKDTNWLDGISTLDMVIIQQHILGITELDSPFKIISADANANGLVSTFDLVLFQALIVGGATDIPGNTSWQFIPADYEFDDPDNPLDEDWPQVLEYSNLDSELEGENWTAIKTGDVTGDAGESSQRSASGTLKINAIERTMDNGIIEMVMETHSDFNIIGFQMEFEYDPEALRSNGINWSFSALGNTGKEQLFVDDKKGIIRLLWYAPEGLFLDAGSELFRLQFQNLADREDGISTLKLRNRGSLWNSEAYDGNGKRVFDLDLDRLIDGLNQDFVLYQNKPNPFKNELVIPFELPKSGEVLLEIFDTRGKLIFTQTFRGVKGENNIELQSGSWPSGSLFYHLSNKEQSAVKKMLRLE